MAVGKKPLGATELEELIKKESMQLSRRSFLIGGALAAAGGISYSLTENSTWKVALKEHQIAVADLPPEFDGYRIGFVSDVHHGPFTPLEWIIESLLILQKNDVDLLLIGGDHLNIPSSLISSFFPVQRSKSFKAKTEIKSAKKILSALITGLQSLNFPDGIIAINGNHDNWNAGSLVKSLFASNNIQYLVNERALVTRGTAKLEIVGIEDLWTGIPALPEPHAKQSDSVRVLLVHNPDYLSYLFRQTQYPFDLALAGHTHGGQICLPGGQPIVSNIQDKRFIAGLVKSERSPVLVSRGLGTVEVPWRINCPPEIHLISLI